MQRDKLTKLNEVLNRVFKLHKEIDFKVEDPDPIVIVFF